MLKSKDRGCHVFIYAISFDFPRIIPDLNLHLGRKQNVLEIKKIEIPILIFGQHYKKNFIMFK